MKLLKPMMMLFLIASVYSCGPRVTTTKMINDSLKQYDTFAYLPNTSIEVKKSKMNPDSVNTAVIQQINNKMIDAGYRLDRSNPDLLVLVSTKTNLEVETDTDPVYASYGYYNRPDIAVGPYYNNYYYRGYATYPSVVGYDTDVYTYREGTLIIQLIDRNTRETVWKGISNTSITDASNVMALTQMVNAIFDEYPLIEK